MLVLTRRTGESIVINDNIFITIMAAQGGTVRVGIDAPPEMPIKRQEIWQNVIKKKGDSASATNQQTDDARPKQSTHPSEDTNR